MATAESVNIIPNPSDISGKQHIFRLNQELTDKLDRRGGASYGAYGIWQLEGGETGFVTTMLFEYMSAMKETLAHKEADSAKEISGKFHENVSRKVCLKKT